MSRSDPIEGTIVNELRKWEADAADLQRQLEQARQEKLDAITNESIRHTEEMSALAAEVERLRESRVLTPDEVKRLTAIADYEQRASPGPWWHAINEDDMLPIDRESAMRALLDGHVTYDDYYFMGRSRQDVAWLLSLVNRLRTQQEGGNAD